ncbi:MAG: hypothetical protein ACYC09_00365 [Bacteroidota bacterium]
MRTLTLIGIMVVGMLFTTQSVEAQFSAESQVLMMVDDNINNNSLQIQDNITTLRAAAGYDWDGEAWTGKIFYEGSLNYYRTVLSRTNQYHSGGALYSLYTGEDGDDILQLTSSFGTGIFRDDYVFYDHHAFSLAVDYKYFLSEWIINTFGYSYRSTSFVNAAGFSSSEHTVYGHAAFALPTNSTVILRAEVGTKYYTEEIATTAKQGGWINTINPDVTQLTSIARIGQRITDETGISATFRYQWNLQKQSRYLIDADGYLLSDDEIFDDRYGYEGLHSSLMVTQLLSESMKIRITGGIANKLYSLLPAYSLDGIVLADQRNDQRSYVSILLEKEFTDLGFGVNTSLDVISNSSNDPFYHYNNTAVTVEFSVPF